MDYFDEWNKLQNQAIEGKNLELYDEFLKMSQVEFSKLYAELKWSKTVGLVENILEAISRQRKWLNQELKEKELPF